MSDLPVKKLNLKALHNEEKEDNNEEKEDTPKKQEINANNNTPEEDHADQIDTEISHSLTEVQKESPKTTKISLGMIKQDTSGDIITKSSTDSDSGEKEKEKEEEISGDKHPIENREEVSVIKNEKGDIIEKESQKTQHNTGKTPPQEEEDSKVHFENYESSFKQQSSNVLKKIQNFHYTPRTRMGFVIGMIVCSFTIVSGLMVLLPEKHSLSIYKASILDIYEESRNPKNEEAHTTSTDIIEEKNKEKPDTTLHTPEETINTEDLSISPIRKEEQEKEKLRQHLLNKYSG